MIIRIVLTIWAAVAVLVVFFCLIRLAWGLLWGFLALVCHCSAYLLDGLAWLWRQARWSA